MARPRWQPTKKDRATVAMMSAAGIDQASICTAIGVSRPTLERACRHELDTGLAVANAAVAKSLFNLATRGPAGVRLGACQFWLKCRGGEAWREPATQAVVLPISAMSEAELDQRIALIPVGGGGDGGEVVKFPPRR